VAYVLHKLLNSFHTKYTASIE